MRISKTQRIALFLPFIWLYMSCGTAASSKASESDDTDAPNYLEILIDSISRIVSDAPGEIGVALIVDGKDTITINNRSIYPMMSVFKLHQALAVCHKLDNCGGSLDSTLCITRDELDANTWSPMMKEHPEAEIKLTIGELLRYTLMLSDNNASNVLFETLADVSETDDLIATLIPRSCFKIAYTEAEMATDHDKAYANYTSPLGATILIDRIFRDSLISNEKQEFIRNALRQCTTGSDRLAAPLRGQDGVTLAHKTGSGYTTTDGILTAHNDVGYICLPNGMRYALAVFIKDFNGTEKQASKYISDISAQVYSQLSAQ